MTVYSEKPKNDFNDYSGDYKAKRDDAYGVELADVGQRFIAIAIDSILLGMVTGALTLGSESFWGSVVGFIIGAAYQAYFLSHSNGQTLGKMLMGVRVVRLDGAPLTGTDGVIRYIGYYINSVIMMLGWFWALIDSRHQGFHDKLVNTIVIKA